MESIGYGTGKGKHLEGRLPLNGLDRQGARISNPEVGEALLLLSFPIATLGLGRKEPLPGPLREHAVGHIRTDFGSAVGEQHFHTLDQGAPGLDQVVDDDNMAASRVPFLEPHDPLVPLADLGADHRGEIAQLLVEALPGAVVGEGDGKVGGVGEEAEAALEEGDAGLEAGEDLVAEVEALLEGVDVECDEAGGPAPGDGDVREDAGHGEGGGDVALLLHPLEGAGGEEGEDEGEGGHEEAGQRVDGRQLLEDDAWRGEGSQEGHVPAPDGLGVVDEEVGEAVVEAPPVYGLEADAVGGGGGHTLGEGRRLRAVEKQHLFLLRPLHPRSIPTAPENGTPRRRRTRRRRTRSDMGFKLGSNPSRVFYFIYL